MFKNSKMHQVISSAGYAGEGRLGRRANTNLLSRIATELPPIHMFACGWKHNVFLTKDHQIYVSGENNENQLGPGIGACLEPTLSLPLSELKPIWVSCGDKITAILTENKTVFVCGSEWGPDPIELIPESLKSISIVYVICGVDNILGISTEGKLYVWYKKSRIAKPCQCPDILCDAAAGKNQIFGLSTTGNLWVMGHSKSCGMGKKWSSLVLQKVNIANGLTIKRIFAYNLLSIAIDVHGRVYVAGTSNFGELGIPNVKKSNTFVHLASMDEHPVLMATIGDTFVAYITEKYELYTCGDGDAYRLCNTSIEKVTTPSRATAAEGHKIMWACAGCSHIIIAEGLESFPVHPGREYFKLEQTMRMRRKKFSPQLFEMTASDQPVSVDTSDRGVIWSGFLPGDVVTMDGKTMSVVGSYSNGVIFRNEEEDKNVLYIVKSLTELYNNVRLISRKNTQMQQMITKSGIHAHVDTTPSAVRAFGLYPGDIVTDIFNDSAEVIGVFGGAIWLKYQEDNGCVTFSETDVKSIHTFLKVVKPKNREITYIKINDIDTPVETKPCEILEEFNLKIGDLALMNSDYCTIKGSFGVNVIVEDPIDKKISLAFPNELMVVRRETTEKVTQTFTTLSGSLVEVEVSCLPDDEYKPRDRVMTRKGPATLIGKKDSKWYLLPDDALALGAGVASTQQPFLGLIRRISDKSVIKNDMDISTSCLSGVIPGDVVILENGEKVTILGKIGDKCKVKSMMPKGDESDEKLLTLDAVKNPEIVFRADLPAKRMYYSKVGNGLFVSVSTKDFVGLRFLPDDVVKTPNGIGLVIGISESDICIHVDKTSGISFFPLTDIYNISEFQLLERRAVSSVLNE